MPPEKQGCREVFQEFIRKPFLLCCRDATHPGRIFSFTRFQTSILRRYEITMDSGGDGPEGGQQQRGCKKAPADPKSKLSISTSDIIRIKTASSFYLFIFYQNYQRLYLPLQILPEKKEKDRENMTRAIFYKPPQRNSSNLTICPFSCFYPCPAEFRI